MNSTNKLKSSNICIDLSSNIEDFIKPKQVLDDLDEFLGFSEYNLESVMIKSTRGNNGVVFESV